MLFDVISNKFAIKKYKVIVEKINDSNANVITLDSESTHLVLEQRFEILYEYDAWCFNHN